MPSLTRCLAALALLEVYVTTSSVVHACYSFYSKTEFADCLDLSQDLALYWQLSDDVASVTFGVDARISNGSWLGIGLSLTGAMKGADMWILRRNGTGAISLQDSFSYDYIMPVKDERQNVILIQAPNLIDWNKGILRYKFKRALVTSDPEDVPIVIGVESQLVWAHGSSTSGALIPHGPNPQSRGTALVTLFADPTIPIAAEPEDLSRIDIRMPKNYIVPTVTTSYVCKRFMMPADKKYHIIKFNTIFNTSLSHHMLVYGCPGTPSPKSSEVYDCLGFDHECPNILIPASKRLGLVSTVFPAEAGVSMGTGANAFAYFVLQIHYNNPEHLENVIDTSGIELFYTKTLRKYDIGTFLTGSVEINIPGGSSTPTALRPNECSSKCTSRFKSNLTIIGATSHMHALGMSQSVEHFRDGVFLDHIFDRKFYDVNFQHLATTGSLGLGSTIRPGDSLITRCTFLPTQDIRNSTVNYGQASSDEMCMNLMMYYPKAETDPSLCTSIPGYEWCDIDFPKQLLSSADVPVNMNVELLMTFFALMVLPFLLVHHILVQRIFKFVEKRYKKPHKLTMYIAYIGIEFIILVLILVVYIVPLVKVIAENRDYIIGSDQMYSILCATSLYFSSAFLYEIFFIRDMNVVLKFHHIVTITLTIVSLYAGLFSVSDLKVTQFLALTPAAMNIHLGLDVIPHAYLIARRMNAPQNIITVLLMLSQWPLTILRGVNTLFYIFLVRYFMYHLEVGGFVIGMTVVISVAVSLLLVAQGYSHYIYSRIGRKDTSKETLNVKLQLNNDRNDGSVVADVDEMSDDGTKASSASIPNLGLSDTDVFLSSK